MRWTNILVIFVVPYQHWHVCVDESNEVSIAFFYARLANRNTCSIVVHTLYVMSILSLLKSLNTKGGLKGLVDLKGYWPLTRRSFIDG
jgi:hypothetical protein